MEARDEAQAARELIRQGLRPLELRAPEAATIVAGSTQVSRRRSITVADKVVALRELATLLKAGVVLDDDPKPVRAADCVQTGELSLSLVLTEGKYHQVKRMLAAVGNRVEGLHRSAIGKLQLPDDLAPGQWRWILPSELEKYFKA